MLNDRLLSGEELAEKVRLAVSRSSSQVYLVSAFLKSEVVDWLDGAIPFGVTVRLLSRWRKVDLISGASDLDVYKLARKRKWGFFIDQALHTKALLIDQHTLFLGSSNYTGSGLGFFAGGNKELNVEIVPTAEEVIRIRNYFSEAYEMNLPMFQRMEDEVMSHGTEAHGDDQTWSHDVEECFVPVIDRLWVAECLTVGPEEYFAEGNNAVNANIWGNRTPSSASLRGSRLGMWLEQQLRDSKVNLRFGDLAGRLHNALISDPRTYRREVKDLVSVLLAWVAHFEIYEIRKYSHTISIVNPYA